MAEDVLVVTGGASGIGLACAVAMAGDHDAVVLLDRNQEALDHVVAETPLLDFTVHGYCCDVTDADGLKDLAGRVDAEVGPVRSLVTSA